MNPHDLLVGAIVLGVSIVATTVALRLPPSSGFAWAMFVVAPSMVAFDEHWRWLSKSELGLANDDTGVSVDRLVSLSAKRRLRPRSRIFILVGDTTLQLQTDDVGNLRVATLHRGPSLPPSLAAALLEPGGSRGA